MQSIMDTCILIVVFTLVVCVLQILFLYVTERSRNLTRSRFNGNRQGGDKQSRREGIPRRGRRQPVEQEEWHTFGTLDFLRHLVNVGCFIVVVDTIVCLVRFALFCLKLQKCRGLLRYRSESKRQNVIKKKMWSVSVPRKFLHFTEFANSKRALTLSLDIVIDPVPLELYNIRVDANNFRPF